MTLNKNYQTIDGATDRISDIPARHNSAMTGIEADMTTIEGTLPTVAQINILNNTSGANTGDETTATIKTKLGITTLSGSNTGDVAVATGAEVTTGTDNVKQVTAKAIKDAGITSSATDGWTPVTGSWTYASASTITVPIGAASLYQKGDKIKFTQTTVKYGVIVAVADTLLTIAVNTDYVVANAAIPAVV